MTSGIRPVPPGTGSFSGKVSMLGMTQSARRAPFGQVSVGRRLIGTYGNGPERCGCISLASHVGPGSVGESLADLDSSDFSMSSIHRVLLRHADVPHKLPVTRIYGWASGLLSVSERIHWGLDTVARPGSGLAHAAPAAPARSRVRRPSRPSLQQPLMLRADRVIEWARAGHRG